MTNYFFVQLQIFKKQYMDQQGIINNFTCPICTLIAIEAVETFCCGKIMCEQCCNKLYQKQHKTCPNCRQQLKVRASPIARSVISNLKISCQNECGLKIPYKQMQEHEKKCMMRITKCRDCDKVLRRKQLVEHMSNNHMESLIQICQQYQSKPKYEEQQKVKGGINKSKISQSKVVLASKGKTCLLGTTGKYYCGGKLIGKCGCCDGYCGPTNGENCDDCMEADVKRLNLPKGCLISPSGITCQFDQANKVFYCGRNVKGLICVPQSICLDCKKVTKSLQIGRYRNLI